MSALLAPRRYSILISRVDPGSDATAEPGMWHSVTAASLGEALRAVRAGALAEVAGSNTQTTRIDAVECVGA